MLWPDLKLQPLQTNLIDKAYFLIIIFFAFCRKGLRHLHPQTNQLAVKSKNLKK